MKWAKHVARMREIRNAYRSLLWKPEGNRQLGKPRRRWENDIRLDLMKTGCEVVDWMRLVQDREQ